MQLRGLQARPELNGCCGSIAEGPLANGRYCVRLYAGDVLVTLAVAPANLVKVSVLGLP